MIVACCRFSLRLLQGEVRLVQGELQLRDVLDVSLLVLVERRFRGLQVRLRHVEVALRTVDVGAGRPSQIEEGLLRIEVPLGSGERRLRGAHLEVQPRVRLRRRVLACRQVDPGGVQGRLRSLHGKLELAVVELDDRGILLHPVTRLARYARNDATRLPDDLTLHDRLHRARRLVLHDQRSGVDGHRLHDDVRHAGPFGRRGGSLGGVFRFLRRCASDCSEQEEGCRGSEERGDNSGAFAESSCGLSHGVFS